MKQWTQRNCSFTHNHVNSSNFCLRPKCFSGIKTNFWSKTAIGLFKNYGELFFSLFQIIFHLLVNGQTAFFFFKFTFLIIQHIAQQLTSITLDLGVEYFVTKVANSFVYFILHPAHSLFSLFFKFYFCTSDIVIFNGNDNTCKIDNNINNNMWALVIALHIVGNIIIEVIFFLHQMEVHVLRNHCTSSVLLFKEIEKMLLIKIDCAHFS